VHDKLFVAKLNAKGAKSCVNLKVSVCQDKGGLSTSDEAKLWFDLPQGRSLFAKLKSNNYLKVLLDNGVTDHRGRKWNLYAGFNATKSLENISLRLGAAHLSDTCNSDNRLKIDHNADGGNCYTWYNRTVVTEGKYVFGMLTAYGLTSHVLSKNNLLFGYNIDENTSAYLRLENQGYRKAGFNWGDASAYFDHLKLDTVSSYRGWRWGVEVFFMLFRPSSTRGENCSVRPFSQWSAPSPSRTSLSRPESALTPVSHCCSGSPPCFSKTSPRLRWACTCRT
jgi:hypothetical protein